MFSRFPLSLDIYTDNLYRLGLLLSSASQVKPSPCQEHRAGNRNPGVTMAMTATALLLRTLVNHMVQSSDLVIL
jgi:hypothetical protein